MNVPGQEWSKLCSTKNIPTAGMNLNTSSQISATQREFADNPEMNEVGINLYHAIY